MASAIQPHNERAAATGVIVLTSSTGREIWRESPDWKHGAFTLAALEALDGKANTDGDAWLTSCA